MKQIFSSLLMCLSFVLTAQDINSYDTNGKRHGIWKKNFEGTEITRYEGEFKNGKETGLFKFYKNVDNKPLLSATKTFNPDTGIADVKFLTSNGKVISEGQMQDKNYIGVWKYYQKNSNQLLTLEHYNENGHLSGERKVYYPNGILAEKQHYKNGKLHGKSTMYSKQNKIISSVVYVEGKLHGEAKYYSKGKLNIEGQYKNDKKYGTWKYYEDGTLTEKKSFSSPSKKP
ncbi:MAG: toxin-antitoxin system YwqK family antitoxin [Aestuariibaculum sp.]